ncbi:hypothetical protein ANO11243_019460 [Dothideomycetidae sp. 11243]|nr:hypothetical protein ANO11243_019460 [fungal sp. No.11243]
MATAPPPLSGIRVVELAGLAPGPYAGLLLADYGATVLRIDRTHPSAHATSPSSPAPTTNDQLTRRKASAAIDLKSPGGRALFLSLIMHADILIDPYRPGVLESLSLAPATLHSLNPRLIIARMTGFRRTGKYAQMAGHDINYLSVSGVLSLLGRADQPPHPPANLLGDFAGGGLVLFTGVLMALLHRASTGQGQVVEANMVDGVAHLATFPRLLLGSPMWDQPRGRNVLDGGCPWYDSYPTREGGYMAVGALEPQFFAALVEGLGLDKGWNRKRMDKGTWPELRELMAAKFREKSRAEWEKVFDGTDACCTPVLEHGELRKGGYDQRPLATLRESPGFAVAGSKGQRDAAEGQGDGAPGNGWKGTGLAIGNGGEDVLQNWTGWKKGTQYEVVNGGLALIDGGGKSKL